MSIREQATAKQIEEVIYMGHPRKSNGTHYTILSKGEERNLLPNAVRLKISGGGQMCVSDELTPPETLNSRSFVKCFRPSPSERGRHRPLLHTVHPQKGNGNCHAFPSERGGIRLPLGDGVEKHVRSTGQAARGMPKACPALFSSYSIPFTSCFF